MSNSNSRTTGLFTSHACVTWPVLVSSSMSGRTRRPTCTVWGRLCVPLGLVTTMEDWALWNVDAGIDPRRLVRVDI